MHLYTRVSYRCQWTPNPEYFYIWTQYSKRLTRTKRWIKTRAATATHSNCAWECRRRKPMTSLMHMRTLIKLVYKERMKKIHSEFMYRKLEFTFHIFKCTGRRMQQQEQHQYSIHYVSLHWTMNPTHDFRKKTNKF